MTKYNSNNIKHKIVWEILDDKSQDLLWNHTMLGIWESIDVGKTFDIIFDDVESYIGVPKDSTEKAYKDVYDYNVHVVEREMDEHWENIYLSVRPVKDLEFYEKAYKEASMNAIFIESMDDTTMGQRTEAKRKAKVAELNLKLARMEARKNGFLR